MNLHACAGRKSGDERKRRPLCLASGTQKSLNLLLEMSHDRLVMWLSEAPPKTPKKRDPMFSSPTIPLSWTGPWPAQGHCPECNARKIIRKQTKLWMRLHAITGFFHYKWKKKTKSFPMEIFLARVLLRVQAWKRIHLIQHVFRLSNMAAIPGYSFL